MTVPTIPADNPPRASSVRFMSRNDLVMLMLMSILLVGWQSPLSVSFGWSCPFPASCLCCVSDVCVCDVRNKPATKTTTTTRQKKRRKKNNGMSVVRIILSVSFVCLSVGLSTAAGVSVRLCRAIEKFEKTT